MTDILNIKNLLLINIGHNINNNIRRYTMNFILIISDKIHGKINDLGTKININYFLNFGPSFFIYY